jgi:hypothetical protein
VPYMQYVWLCRSFTFIYFKYLQIKKSSFETSILSYSVRLHGTGIHEFTNLVISQLFMSSVVCSCDGKRPMHSENIEL